MYILWYTVMDLEEGEWPRRHEEASVEDILTTMARQFLPQMTREERSEALLSLRRLIDEGFFALAVAESGDEPLQDDLAKLQEDPVPVLRLLGQAGEVGRHCEGCAAACHGRASKPDGGLRLDVCPARPGTLTPERGCLLLYLPHRE